MNPLFPTVSCQKRKSVLIVIRKFDTNHYVFCWVKVSLCLIFLNHINFFNCPLLAGDHCLIRSCSSVKVQQWHHCIASQQNFNGRNQWFSTSLNQFIKSYILICYYIPISQEIIRYSKLLCGVFWLLIQHSEINTSTSKCDLQKQSWQ